MTSDSDLPRQDNTTDTTPELPRHEIKFFPSAREPEDRTLFSMAHEQLWEEPGPDELPDVDYDQHWAEVLNRSAGLRAQREETEALEEAFAAPAAVCETSRPPADSPSGARRPASSDQSAAGTRDASRSAANSDDVIRRQRWKLLSLSALLLITAIALPCIAVAVMAQGSSNAAWITTGICAVSTMVLTNACTLALARAAQAMSRGRRVSRGSQQSRVRSLRERRARAARVRLTIHIGTQENDVKKQP
ncbi:hypothetical protein ACWGH5_39335 [Streptomyces sp. NPDC054864]